MALYTDEGAKIVLKRGRIVETECDVYRVKCKRYEVEAEENAAFTTPLLTASDKLTVEGKITGNGGMAISGGEKYVTTFEGNINHVGGVITSVDVTINGVKIGTHKHDTPHGISGLPHN